MTRGRRPEFDFTRYVKIWPDGIPYLEVRSLSALKQRARQYFDLPKREFRVLSIEPDTTYPQFQGLVLVTVIPGPHVVRWRLEHRGGARRKKVVSKGLKL